MSDRNDQPPTGPLSAPIPRPPAVPPPAAMAQIDRPLLGITLMCCVSLIFATQDAFSRVLGERYPPVLIVMLRYWFLAMLVIALAARQPGGLRAMMHSRRPRTQIFRGVLLAAEIVVTIHVFVQLGLIQAHAIFACYPLLISAFSGPVLGEKVGWRRWAAVAVGFIGILIVLSPWAQSSSYSLDSLLALVAAAMFALYGLLTRLVARDDPAQISFFWTGISGAVAATVAGIWFWQPIAPHDWLLIAAVCVTSTISHWLLIRAYEVAEASILQPFAYLQLIFVSAYGVILFSETLRPNVVVGAAIVVGAGLFTLWRARMRSH